MSSLQAHYPLDREYCGPRFRPWPAMPLRRGLLPGMRRAHARGGTPPSDLSLIRCYSPLAGSPEPLEYEEADPGIPDPRAVVSA